jgi:hypothetical protein
MTAVPDAVTTPIEDLLARARAYITNSHAKISQSRAQPAGSVRQ